MGLHVKICIWLCEFVGVLVCLGMYACASATRLPSYSTGRSGAGGGVVYQVGANRILFSEF